MNWRIISDGALSGFENMAIDEAILKEVEKGLSPPTIRLYRWSPHCISLGKHQDPSQELNLDRIANSEIHFVKRYTGGRVVFHAEELTYSVIAPQSVAKWGDKLASTYEEISLWLLQGLAPLHPEFSLERGDVVVKSPKNQVAQACFASTAKSELVLTGKKLIGSAQRRTRKSFLQHGSILVGQEHEKVVEYLNLDVEQKAIYFENLKSNSISTQEVGILLNPEELQSQLLDSFFTLDIGVKLGALSDAEQALSQELSSMHQSYFKELL